MGYSTSGRVKSNSTPGAGLFRKLLRRLLQAAGRLLLFFLADVHIQGKQNFPKKGPLILAGNHVGLMEVVMMAVYPPYLMEFLGSGDIPLDPQFSWIAKIWGFVPVRRGNLDREAIRQSVAVLRQKGVIAVFPEGGIWSPENMPARLGIALISSRAEAPVLPIGFGGVQHAFQALMTLKRPRLTMHVGEVLPAIAQDQPGLSRKQVLAMSANEILAHIQVLVPASNAATAEKQNERFTLKIRVIPMAQLEEDLHGAIPDGLRPSLAKLLLHPVMMDIFVRNLKLPVEALVRLKNVQDPQRIADSVRAVIDYLDTNPGFLTYRFGMAEGIMMKEGLIALHALADRASRQGLELVVRPVHSWIDAENGKTVVEDEVKKPDLY